MRELVGELQRLNELEEVSVSGHGTTSILVLFNSQSSFLIYFRFQDEDHGFQSVDLERDRNKNEEFILSNGHRARVFQRIRFIFYRLKFSITFLSYFKKHNF